MSKGQHAHSGIDGVGSERTIHKLSWCVYEALREADAKFLVHKAHTVWLARDARRQRLLVRFRAVGFHGGELVSRVGVLGHWKDFDPAATGIVEATKAIVMAAVATGQDKPPGLHNARRACKTDAHRASSSSAEAAAIVLNKIEALTVDAANDETLAGELMRGRCCLGEEQSLCPNLRLVVRDKTHASRRNPGLRVTLRPRPGRRPTDVVRGSPSRGRASRSPSHSLRNLSASRQDHAETGGR